LNTNNSSHRLLLTSLAFVLVLGLSTSQAFAINSFGMDDASTVEGILATSDVS